MQTHLKINGLSSLSVGWGGGGEGGGDGSTDSCQSAGQPPVKDSRSNGFSLQLESAAAISCRLEVEGVSS